MEVAKKKTQHQDTSTRVWKEVKLGDLGTFRKGRNIPKSNLKTEGHRCILYGEIYTKYHFIASSLDSKIDYETARQSEEIQYGDILFAGSGETAEEIGKCVAYLGKEVAYAGGDIVIFRATDANPEFLGYILNSTPLIDQKSKLGQGSSVIHIYARNLRELNIPLPPLQEQKAIAAALSNVDALIQKLEDLIQKKENIKKATMQLLLTGKKRLDGFDGEWEKKYLEELTINIASGSSSTKSQKGDYPIYGSTGIIGRDTNHDYYGEKILVARVGANAGSLYKVKDRYNVSDNTLMVTLNDRCNINFINELLKEVNLSRLVFGSGQPLITGTQLKNLSLMIPPIKEQEAIALILSEMISEIQFLNQKRKKYIKVKKGMMQELLTGKTRLA